MQVVVTRHSRVIIWILDHDDRVL